MVRAGADPNKLDKGKRTPLHDAVDNNLDDANVTSEMEAALIAVGVDSTAVDVNGRMALHYAFIDKTRYEFCRNYFLLKVNYVYFQYSDAWQRKQGYMAPLSQGGGASSYHARSFVYFQSAMLSALLIYFLM